MPLAVAPGQIRHGKVLVVGGAGYVGSVLVRNLLDAGYHVVVVDPLLYGGESLAEVRRHPAFSLHVADTRDEHVLADVLRDVFAVVHLGEIVGDPACNLDPSLTVTLNLRRTALLARLARDAGVRRFIYPSSCSVYGATERIVDETSGLNPVSLYARTKIAAEEVVLGLASADFHPTVFRLATVYGLSPRPRFDLVVNGLSAGAVVNGRMVLQGGGQWRPFVHVRDVAGVFADAITLPTADVSGRIFNLGSNDQNFTIRAVAELVQRIVPTASLEVSETVDNRNYRVSFERIAKVIGFRPQHTVADGVREIVSAVTSGRLSDTNRPDYSNVRALVETEARTRLWRTDDVDVDAAAPFRPRDSEAAAAELDRVGELVPQRSVEGAA